MQSLDKIYNLMGTIFLLKIFKNTKKTIKIMNYQITQI